MPAFPTLSIAPTWPTDEEREDATIRSEMEGGYQHTRPRYTRIRRRFKVIYHMLPEADKSGANKLDALVTTVREGSDSFTWNHPATSTQYTVRFEKIPQYKCVLKNAVTTYYDVEFTLLEV